jgi:hypothetical protein
MRVRLVSTCISPRYHLHRLQVKCVEFRPTLFIASSRVLYSVGLRPIQSRWTNNSVRGIKALLVCKPQHLKWIAIDLEVIVFQNGFNVTLVKLFN